MNLNAGGPYYALEGKSAKLTCTAVLPELNFLAKGAVAGWKKVTETDGLDTTIFTTLFDGNTPSTSSFFRNMSHLIVHVNMSKSSGGKYYCFYSSDNWHFQSPVARVLVECEYSA